MPIGLKRRQKYGQSASVCRDGYASRKGSFLQSLTLFVPGDGLR